MVQFNSPGVYVRERDISEYAPTVDSSIVGIVGYASRGPTNKATLITNSNQLVQTFGEPSESIPYQGLEGAIEILEATNQIYFVRASASDAGDASGNVAIGSCPAVQVSANAFGVTQNLYLQLQVYDNDGIAKFSSAKSFSIPSGTVTFPDTQALALRTVLGGGLDADVLGAHYNDNTLATGFIVGHFAGSGARLEVTSFSDSAFTTPVSALLPLNLSGNAIASIAASSVSAHGATFFTTGASSLRFVAQSKYEGQGYNLSSKSDGTVVGLSVEVDNLGGQRFNFVVNEGGAAVETHRVALTDLDFIEDTITSLADSTQSNWIKGELFYNDLPGSPTELPDFVTYTSSLLGIVSGTGYTPAYGATARVLTTTSMSPRFCKFLEQTVALDGGTNGTSSISDLIGDATADPKTGVQALSDDLLNISIGIVPGVSNQNVQNALVTLAETTQEFIAVVSPPFAIGTPQDAIDWSNGKSDTRTAALNSSYAAITWPWVRVFSVFDGKDRWYDPAIFSARQMVYTDNVAEAWEAPAGFRRGRLTKPTEVEVRLSQGDRDAMYSGGNVINPVVNFPQQGITIFGQRTAQRNPTALDRINVRRMLILLRKIILQSTRQFVFEPNDEFTWQQIEEVLNPLLDDIKRRRGLIEFRVVCDETTNTPARVDRNELWTKVLLKPTKSAESIVFELNVTNQSAKLGNL